MKIAVINDIESSGGAAIAASRLVAGLRKKGLDVMRFVNVKETELVSTIDCGSLDLKDRLINKFVQKVFSNSNYLSHIVNLKVLKQVKRFNPDIVNIHNIHSALMSVDLVEMLLNAGFKLVWTLHDMWSFTGHCAYTYDCDKYKSFCNESCPRPMEYPSLNIEKIEKAYLKRKNIVSRHRNLVFVSPSKWLALDAQKGMLANHRIEVIPNGIDMSIFSPFGKKAARNSLKIPVDAKIVLTASQDLQDKRKGWVYLEKAMRQLDTKKKVVLLTYGNPHCDSRPKENPYETINLGTIKDEGQIAICYSSADVFVLPTLADNLPNVLIESISCGTPCIAFDVGGVPDVVRLGATGFLANYKDPDDLAKKISAVLTMDNEKTAILSKNCRNIALAEYSMERQADSYYNLFQEICGVE